jgi:hypothetical protein
VGSHCGFDMRRWVSLPDGSDGSARLGPRLSSSLRSWTWREPTRLFYLLFGAEG